MMNGVPDFEGTQSHRVPRRFHSHLSPAPRPFRRRPTAPTVTVRPSDSLFALGRPPGPLYWPGMRRQTGPGVASLTPLGQLGPVPFQRKCRASDRARLPQCRTDVNTAALRVITRERGGRGSRAGDSVQEAPSAVFGGRTSRLCFGWKRIAACDVRGGGGLGAGPGGAVWPVACSGINCWTAALGDIRWIFRRNFVRMVEWVATGPGAR